MKTQIHNSHKMTKPECEVRSPSGTQRFYSVSKCKKCKHECIEHPAGKFTDEELYSICNG